VSENANVFADDWDDPFPPTEGWHSHVKRLIPPGNDLGLSMWELLPKQTQVPYHFHHGADELILVLRGRPTLRTPAGERELEAGDVVHFPKGPAGAHQVINRTDEPIRYVLASSNASPEVVEYPDSRKIAVASRLESQLGERLWSVLRFEDVDYFEGEEPTTGA
jgi:quercetin dioxygenase-like cupin family protein